MSENLRICTLTNAEPVAERLRAGGMSGASVEVAADADLHARLLALTGRRP